MHKLIPITRQLGIKVVSYDGERLKLGAPLAANINHQGSVFGGSLYSVAALAGWGLLQLKLTELNLDCETVIAEGTVSYLKPMLQDFVCTAALPADYQALFTRLATRGRVTMAMTATIAAATKETEPSPAMTLTGNYHLKQRQQA